MKTLYLLRHATAVSQILSFADFDRPLNDPGRVQAETVAQYIKDKNINFDYVMCSAALRAQETLEPIRKVIETEDIEISPSFYNISDDQILEALRKVSDVKEKLLYIGHNPGIAFSILKLAKLFPEIVKEGITPATLIGFQLPIDGWSDLAWWEGKVIDVFQPPLPSTEPPAQKES